MNIKLLLAVREEILANPESYDQTSLCGTACCIAGHAVAIADPDMFHDPNMLHDPNAYKISNRAQELLGLDRLPYIRLCTYAQDWPDEFSRRYYRRFNSNEERATIAGDAIIDFILTDGWTKPKASWNEIEIDEAGTTITQPEPELEGAPK